MEPIKYRCVRCGGPRTRSHGRSDARCWACWTSRGRRYPQGYEPCKAGCGRLQTYGAQRCTHCQTQTIVCSDCRSEAIVRSPRAVRCKPCYKRAKSRREYARRPPRPPRQASPSHALVRYPIPRYCGDCRVLIGPRKRFCSACAKARIRGSLRDAQRRRKERIITLGGQEVPIADLPEEWQDVARLIKRTRLAIQGQEATA